MLKIILCLIPLLTVLFFVIRFYLRKRLERKKEAIIKAHDSVLKYANPLTPFRNVACPCGSGRKAKKCHGFDNFVTASERIEILEMVRKQMNNIAVEVNKKLTGDF